MTRENSLVIKEIVALSKLLFQPYKVQVIFRAPILAFWLNFQDLPVDRFRLLASPCCNC